MSDDRPVHAPCFVKRGEPEPNTVGGYGLTDTTDRRTFAVRKPRQALRESRPDQR
jgi:hypothetical protein